MLQNINVLAGETPVKSGNLGQDLENCISYLHRLQAGLEQLLDQLDHRLTAIERKAKQDE